MFSSSASTDAFFESGPTLLWYEICMKVLLVPVQSGVAPYHIEAEVWATVCASVFSGVSMLEGCTIGGHDCVIAAADMRNLLTNDSDWLRSQSSVEPCFLCGGTGVRTDAVSSQMGFSRKIISDPLHPRNGQTGWCNGCDGVGIRDETGGRLNTFHFAKFLKAFALFLDTCGGLRIREI
jgi:hypothetical protein